MKLLRLRVRGYRGIAEREVVFAPTGVTVVHGPNEVGKSSLAEAIDLLFEELDTSTRKSVRDTKPVHQDVGTEIEVEAESGVYAFTYSKRFHRERETRLSVTRPRPESLTGRPAHERMLAILEETLDVALWRALRILQGASLEQAPLASQVSLSRALDRAAGGVATGEREETLVTRVREEYLLYYTPTGREGTALAEAVRAAAAAEGEVARLAEDVARFELDVERAERLGREIAAAELEEAELAPRVADHERALAEIAALRTEREQRSAVRDAAAAEQRARTAAVDERARIAADAGRTGEARERLAREQQGAAPTADAAQREFANAETAAKAARTAFAEKEAFERLRRTDREFRRGEIELAQFEERHTRYLAARRDAAPALELLAKTRVTDALVSEIREAQLAAVAARARLEAGSPTVRLRALRPIAPEIGGRAVPLRAGESAELAVAETLHLTLPGVAEIEVTGGVGAGRLGAALDEAERTVARLLAAAGVADLSEAEVANEARREAERRRGALETAQRDDLRDWSLTELEERIAGLQRRVSAYPGERPTEPPLAPSLDAAKARLGEAEAALAGARAQAAAADAGLEAARARRDATDRSRRDAQVRLSVTEEAHRQAEDRLAVLRAESTDATLGEALAAARDRALTAADALEGTEGKLRALDPEAVELRAAGSRAALATVRAALARGRDERRTLAAVLAERGEAGLQEQLDTARGVHARNMREGAALRRRATAAKTLHDALEQERSRARQAYVAPLRRQIERLGALVFGPGFEVELDDELRVTSRALAGVVVPFESLSAGAREQIALLSRLACAICVAEDGGVPVVVDDALGYTDSSRLEGMAAALSVAARSCQILVLTCAPERYRHVAGARVVSVA